MPIDNFLLSILVCPETKRPVLEAKDEIVQKLNQQIQLGQLKARAGHQIKQNFESGLIREDGKVFFPVRDGIPIMLMEEAIDLA